MAVLKVMPMNQFLLYLADSVIIFGNLYLYRFINIFIIITINIIILLFYYLHRFLTLNTVKRTRGEN